MAEKRNLKQRILQVSSGIALIIFVVGIKFFSGHPPGIYSYTDQGYKEFKIGFSKDRVIKKINQHKSIRSIRVCNPDRLFEKKSIKFFKPDKDMILSDIWICHDRTGKDFLFLFKQDILVRILVQQLKFGKKDKSILFSRCIPEISTQMDTYLALREKLKVFYDTDTGRVPDVQ